MLRRELNKREKIKLKSCEQAKPCMLHVRVDCASTEM